ncbi:four helix bundle protein [Algoriella sp.]|uniref:four helix bundle protein n=1 Tax=Algoriella sp. TaxID=1872434 RepID=UPI002FC5D2B8
MANILKEKSFDLALNIIQISKDLQNKNEYVLSKQLLRSGTAIGALVRESQNAESSKDFIHKLSIAQKECDETLYWLELLFKSNYLEEKLFYKIFSDCT